MICMVRCGSVTTNNDMVHVYWLVGVAVVLAIIRTTWIRWRPGPNSIDFNKRLYCCLGCCSCCYVDPAGGEYDQLDAATKQKKGAKNVKRVSVNDTKKKKTKKGKSGADDDGTTSESRGKGHVDHAVDDINLAPLDQFLDEDDKRSKKKKRSSKERQNGIKPRLSGDDESDDNDDLPHEVKADDSHQFVISETDNNGLPLEEGEEGEDDGVGVDLEKIIRGATVAESKRTQPSQPPQNATVAITVTTQPPPPQPERKKAVVAAAAQQAEEATSLV
jgi:hypothetical protein